MTYAERLRAALIDNLTTDWLVFMPRWSVQRRCAWQAKGAVPNALLIHHTAAAATSSTNPKAPGNQKGANANVINYIQNHPLGVPAASVTLDRDGTCYIHSAFPVFHAGMGAFTVAPWKSLGIPANKGNDYMAGVEVMSKGTTKDWTVAQQDSLVHLLRAFRDASDWDNIGLLRRPQHKDWTTRKIDTLYSNVEIGKMILKYGFAAA